MSAPEALKAAVDLFHLPSQVRVVRSLPLPKGTAFLLRLASGDAQAAREAEVHSDRSAHASCAAAIFFIEQILLSPESDEYRVLDLDHTATSAELRAHMALLLKWLHPDRTSDEHQALMARRVIEAWNKVKSSEGHLARNGKTETLVPGLPKVMPSVHPLLRSPMRSLSGGRNRELVRLDQRPKKSNVRTVHRYARTAERFLKFLSCILRRRNFHYKN
jgi:hypothetical protein